MQKIRLIVQEYNKFSKHTLGDDYDFNCIGMKLTEMQEFSTGNVRQNWAHGNKVQLKRLINGGNVELCSHEQMYAIADDVHKTPTFYVVTISDIATMFETNWVYWLPKNTINFLKETGIPILLSQPGEFGFEWLDTDFDSAWYGQLVINLDLRLKLEGLINPIIIHNMSKLYMDLGVEQRNVESVYSRQWIEHVKLPSNLSRGFLTYNDHLENLENKKVFFCSNRAPREARCMLMLSMLRHNTLDNGYFSFLCEAPATVKLDSDQIKGYFESLKYFSDTADENFIEYSKYIDAAFEMLPIELDEDKQLQQEHVLANKSINKYRLGSFFEIVTETHDYTKESVQAGVLSEKVFWPILNQMPFIVLGHRGNTRLLHELGFKTFDEDLLVESHPGDSLSKRVEYINRVIKYFYNLNKEEKAAWFKQDSVKEKIMYNYDKLVNTDWNQDEIAALSAAFSKVMYNH